MQRLVLIDGNAILYRAFHALPETLTLKDGSPVNAVYGFTSMLLGVVEKLNPNYLICAFDLPKPTFRDKLYKDYRAQRPKAPEKLIAQIGMVKNVVRAFKIPIYEVEGYEADDVIGTLARQTAKVSSGTNFFSATNSALRRTPEPPASISRQTSVRKSTSTSQPTSSRRTGLKQPPPAKKLSPSEASYASNNTLHITHHTSRLETIIVTGDRDLLQLVDGYTKVYIPIRGLSKARMYGERDVEEKYGINPEQMVDYKALVGDPSDNYPGVKGIGPKTACSLISKYGSLEKIYRIIDDKKNIRPYAVVVQTKTIELLKKYKKDALMAKKLAKIVTDIPVELDLEAAKVSRFDTLDVKELFDKLSFKTLWRRVKESQKSSPKDDQPQAEKADQLSML